MIEKKINISDINISDINISDIRKITQVGFIGIQHSLPNFSLKIFDFLMYLRPNDSICHLGYYLSQVLLGEEQYLQRLYDLHSREKEDQDFSQIFWGFIKLLGHDEITLHYKVHNDRKIK